MLKLFSRLLKSFLRSCPQAEVPPACSEAIEKLSGTLKKIHLIVLFDFQKAKVGNKAVKPMLFHAKPWSQSSFIIINIS